MTGKDSSMIRPEHSIADDPELTIPDVSVAVIYDLRDASAWQRAHEHRRLWGRHLADFHVLDENHVVIEFRSGGERWLAWEKRRLDRILAERGAAA
jgi:hypothetical protein